MSVETTVIFPAEFESPAAQQIREFAAQIVRRASPQPVTVADKNDRIWTLQKRGESQIDLAAGPHVISFAAKYAYARFGVDHSEVHEPISFEQIKLWKKRLDEGNTTSTEIRGTWQRTCCSYKTLFDELMAMKKDELARMTVRGGSGDTKPALARSVIHSVYQWFTPGSTMGWSPFTETIEQAVDRQVQGWTDAEIQREADERKEKTAAFEKAVKEPETLEEFNRFVEFWGRRGWTKDELDEVARLNGPDKRDRILRHGEKKLTPDQLAKYDAMRAAVGRERREADGARQMEIKSEQLPSNVSMTVKETLHTLKGHKLWVVQLSERVDREVYTSLLERAKQLGGYYSSYTKGGAIPGFTFDVQEKAQSFISLEKIDGSQRMAERQEERREAAVEHLNAISGRLVERGEEKLAQPRRENTHRRVRMAESAESSARATIQLGQTIDKLAEAVSTEKVSAIQRIQSASQVETFEAILRRCKWEKIRQLQKIDPSVRAGTELDRPYAVADAAFAAYPWPHPHRDHVRSLVEGGKLTPGAKLLSERVRKMLRRCGNDDCVLKLSSSYEIEMLRELAAKLKYQMEYRGSALYVTATFEDHDRLKRMDIHTDAELRAAVREYISIRSDSLKADPIRQAERDLQGIPIEGFFPTPPRLAAQVVEMAGIEPGMKVLEPEAGKGDLADAVRTLHPECELHVVEKQYRLVELLKLKGHQIAYEGDFLDFNPGPIYDRIVMNPPFEDGQDIEHVKHAFNLLSDGGRVVAIVSEAPFFHSSAKAQDFRAWLETLDGTAERNPDGAFAGADAFRSTGVATRTITIDRVGEKIAVRSPDQSSTAGIAI